MMIPPLLEWKKTTVGELTSAQIADLLSIDGIRVEARPDGQYDVTPTGNLVGYVRRGETSVVIHPSKCSAELVIFMMGYADNPKFLGNDQVNFDHSEDLLEAFISVFVRRTMSAINRGLYRTYRSIDDELSVIRGRVRLSDQITRKFRLVPPISVSFDEYTVDNTENRLIKAAVEISSRMPLRNERTLKDLQFLRAMFSEVEHIEFDRRWLPEQVWTRLNEHLSYPVHLAKRIIQNSSISLERGSHTSDEFLINMANVFEDFVATAIREELKLTNIEMPRANELRNNLYLDTERKIRLKPDLSRWEGAQCVAIGDVKYKRTTAEGVLHPDIYQLLAYATATKLPRASIIYACGKGERDELMVGNHRLRETDITIDVFVLDLTQSSQKVLEQVSEIARAFEPQIARSKVTVS
jgi:5-methylcytosine-specific restriction enzyme subunit McrC